MEGDVVDLLKVVKDKDTASVLGGADTVLVIKAGVPKNLELPLFPHLSLSGDRWVVFVEGDIVLVKQCHHSWLVLVGRIGEYEAGEFAGFRTGKADQETRLKEELSYSSEVVVLWLDVDGGEGINGGFEFGGDV